MSTVPWPAPAPATILLGECRAVLAGLPDAVIDVVITSPPYNLGASPSANEHPHSSRGQSLDWQGYEADPDCVPEWIYQADQVAVLTELYRVSRPGASCFYVHKDRRWDGHLISPLAWLYRTPWHIRQQIVWDRGAGHELAGWYFDPQHEYVFWLVKGAKHANLGGLARYGSVWEIPVPIGAPLRRGMFPLELPRRCLETVAPLSWVLDPYCGTGQTGVATRLAGCSFLGIDRSAAAVELARRQVGAVDTVADLPLFAGVLA